MSILYKCPVCGDELLISGSSLVCRKRHTFDIAKEGYVNLAVGKAAGGDSREMCASRRRFLAGGYYEKFAKLISDTLLAYVTPEAVLDAGCGEGYYLRYLKNSCKNAELFGIDLAKEAIKLASKSEKPVSEGQRISYSVSGIFGLPFFDSSFDAVLSVFAPVGELENARVLKDGKYLIVASPGKRHLSGLKSAIYEKPYENPEKHREFSGFRYVDSASVYYTETIPGEHIIDLFTMTPYYWKTSRSDSEKLCRLSVLETELEFITAVYQKI